MTIASVREAQSSGAPSALESILLNDWHVVGALESLSIGHSYRTRLFGVDIAIELLGGDSCMVRRLDTGAEIASATKYGLVWASLGTPERAIIEISEAQEDDRYILTGGAFGVHVSGLRAVENFLDMSHLPFVHAGYLGAEPHTEILPYDVEITDQGIVASNCRIYQPLASPVATDGALVDYIFKVFRPYAAALYKSNPIQRHRMDFIGLFVQPVDEENCIAHSLLCYLKEGASAAAIRAYMQFIFAQDKPILENQRPRRLPLDPRAEMPVRADRSSIMYRRWLTGLGVRYGALALEQRAAPAPRS